MLTKEQLQQVREKIILARHPECKTIEEAMEKELNYFGCVFIHPVGNKVCTTVIPRLGNIIAKTYEEDCEDDIIVIEELERNIKKIIGLPLDLASVLNALYKTKIKNGSFISFTEDMITLTDKDFVIEIICPWQLLKDGKPCTFDDQTPETQEAMAKVLGII